MKFGITFDGYCDIEAKDEKEAELLFWKMIAEDKPLPSNFYAIDCIERLNKEW